MSPVAPLHPCPKPGCPDLTHGGPCLKHRRERERARGSAAVRGYGSRQRHWRDVILGRDPLCRGCERKPSNQADHIVLRKPGAEDWSEENGQGLCRPCHSWKTAIEQRDSFFGLRLREAGAKIGQPAPYGWRHLSDFGG